LLSPEKVRQYESDGYLFPIQVLSSAEVDGYRAEEERLHQALAALDNPKPPNQVHLHFRWAYDLVSDARILDVVEAILGPDILVHSTTIFGKQPGDERYVSWHQDGYYMNLDTPAFVSAWVALTDSDTDNGCLRVIPGSHRPGRLPHGETARSEKNLLASGMEVGVDVDEGEAVDLTLRPGEASLHHVDLIHGSRANESGRSRVGVAIRYVAPHVKQAIKHHETLLVRGRDTYHHYDVREAAPSGSLVDGIASMLRLADRIRETRQAQGLPT